MKTFFVMMAMVIVNAKTSSALPSTLSAPARLLPRAGQPRFTCIAAVVPEDVAKEFNTADLVIPTADGSFKVRIESTKSFHHAFLRVLFKFLDRDNSETLDSKECEHLFPLIASSGRTVTPKFYKLDGNKDGKVTVEEFVEQLRKQGCNEIINLTGPPDDKARLADAVLFQKLDRNRDGKLDRAELESAARILKLCDENEDELLERAELVGGSTNGKQPRAARWEAFDKPDLTLHFTPEGRLVPALGVGEGKYKEGMIHFICEDDCEINREFYLAPFNQALGEKPSLPISSFADDTLLVFVAPIAEFADRNGDGKLTLTELEGAIDLLETGWHSQIAFTLHDQGRPLFSMLDADSNGKLDLRELNRAAKVLLKDDAKQIAAANLPRSINLVVNKGMPTSSFGPVQISEKQPARATPQAARAGPDWFQALDRNRDNLVSPREFPGTPDAFRKLDRDGDGVISIEEATTRH